jgi:hypothetical protein
MSRRWIRPSGAARVRARAGAVRARGRRIGRLGAAGVRPRAGGRAGGFAILFAVVFLGGARCTRDVKLLPVISFSGGGGAGAATGSGGGSGSDGAPDAVGVMDSGDAADLRTAADAGGADGSVTPPPDSAVARDADGSLDAGDARGADGVADAGGAPDAGGPPDSGGAPDAVTALDAGADGVGAASCSGLGDPIQLPTAAGATCAASLSARGHRFALCSCQAMSLTARLRTDAFDSSGATAQDDSTAAVGIGGALQTTVELRAGGAVYVAGAGGVNASDHLQSGRSLRVAGPLTMLASKAETTADAFVAGDLSGTVRIGGTLHVPAGAALGADVQAAAIAREPVAVPAPCDCSAGFADIAGAISAAAARNDDAAAALAPDLLARAAPPARVDLSCGTFYLDAIEAPAALTLAVHGRALLAVGGDVTLGGGLSVALDAGAELDLLVGGALSAAGGASIGTTAAPARFRIWTAGSAPLELDDGPVIGAVIHAPAAQVAAPAGFELFGGVLARSFTLGGEARLHFDQAVLAGGQSCGALAALPVP